MASIGYAQRTMSQRFRRAVSPERPLVARYWSMLSIIETDVYILGLKECLYQQGKKRLLINVRGAGVTYYMHNSNHAITRASMRLIAYA